MEAFPTNLTDGNGQSHDSAQSDSTQQLIETKTEVQSQYQDTSGVSAVYFCFMGESADNPNRILLSSAAPTVSDLCSTMKILFFPCQDVHLSCVFLQGGTQSEFGDTSTYRLPVNNKAHVIFLKLCYNEIPQLPLHTLQISQWLAENDLDTIEIMTIFQQNNITLDNMRYLTEDDMMLMGVRDWGSRVALREAIKKHFAIVPKIVARPAVSNLPVATNPMASGTSLNLRPSVLPAPSSNLFPATTPQSPTSPPPASPFVPPMTPGTPIRSEVTKTDNLKRKLSDMSSTPTTPSSKKLKMGKQKIKFKELNVLVSDPTLPVHIGSHTFCRGSDIKGEVILNKHKKPMIRTTVDGKEHLFTVAQFFNHATGQRLQAKGESWGNIFFTDAQTNTARSLADIKYLVEGPKKAVSAFLYFSKEIRDSLPRQDFARKSGNRRSRHSSLLKPYKKLEEEDKIRFAKEKAEWAALRQQANLDTAEDWNGSNSTTDQVR